MPQPIVHAVTAASSEFQEFWRCYFGYDAKRHVFDRPLPVTRLQDAMYANQVTPHDRDCWIMDSAVSRGRKPELRNALVLLQARE